MTHLPQLDTIHFGYYFQIHLIGIYCISWQIVTPTSYKGYSLCSSGYRLGAYHCLCYKRKPVQPDIVNCVVIEHQFLCSSTVSKSLGSVWKVLCVLWGAPLHY